MLSHFTEKAFHRWHWQNVLKQHFNIIYKKLECLFIKNFMYLENASFNR